ncbi:MAG: MoxR family ATPase [Candidatus Brocadiae bacterium]|nr:MoxR family ATPase [Candidatus Brocadiia bacterium]
MPVAEEKVKKIANAYQNILASLKKRIVGMEDVVEQVMVCLLSSSHALLVGVPGLAKTLLIRSLADLMDLKFSRIQFTPDLMPSDITGTEILMQEENSPNRSFQFLPGPIFANLVLADEINRTPPKTQSALLEAMEENTVSSLGQRFSLSRPFLVFATQNPIEQEGTYPLPAAQLDRFMFNILLDYPNKEQERSIMRLTVSSEPEKIEPVLSKEEILEFMELVRNMDMPVEMMRYCIELCRMSRPGDAKSPAFIKDFLAWGASPRAAQGMILGSKARALLHGRQEVTTEDIVSVAYPVMRHRIILNYRSQADGITPDEIIYRLLASVPSPGGLFHVQKQKYSEKLYLFANRQ